MKGTFNPGMLRYIDISPDKKLEKLGQFVSDELIEVSAIVDHYSSRLYCRSDNA